MSVGPEPTCDADTTNILNDEDHCGFIKRPNGPFAECMNVNPELVNGFFEDCIYDACALWGNPDDVEEQMCNTLATLFLACQEELIGPIDYRSQICPPSMYDLYDEFWPLVCCWQNDCPIWPFFFFLWKWRKWVEIMLFWKIFDTIFIGCGPVLQNRTTCSLWEQHPSFRRNPHFRNRALWSPTVKSWSPRVEKLESHF